MLWFAVYLLRKATCNASFVKHRVAGGRRLDMASAKAFIWSDCKMYRNNESSMLFAATDDVLHTVCVDAQFLQWVCAT